jgi:hypothetical protein
MRSITFHHYDRDPRLFQKVGDLKPQVFPSGVQLATVNWLAASSSLILAAYKRLRALI